MKKTTLIYLEPEPESREDSARIICRETISGDKIATVYCDSSTQYVPHREYNSKEIDQINFVKNNFWFLYDNLTIKNERS